MAHHDNFHRILVIDDDPLCREVIACALHDYDYDVIEAADGERGLELAKERSPDLIICDINMEGLNGYDVLTEIRRDPNTVLIPLILITGDVEHYNLRHGMELGADDYLAKPFSIPELISAVQARYKKFQAFRQMAEKRVDEICSSISLSLPHELLTPLTGILGIAQVLRDSGQNMPSNQLAELSQLIIDSGNRLHRLINNFLIYTQIELLIAKPQEMEKQTKRVTQNTKPLIVETANTYALNAGRTNDLQLDLHEGSAAISEDFLIKIVQELLDNAFKFSEIASPVLLSTRVVDNSFVLTIIDQGIGMPSERISQIGAFMQFDRKNMEQQGSGLGLAIIKRFLEIHKGSLEIESVPKLGTTVRIWLPQKTS